MVDSLNSQLSELGSSDALARARQQHEAIVAGLRQKMDAESTSSNHKIDTMNQQLINKVNILWYLNVFYVMKELCNFI